MNSEKRSVVSLGLVSFFNDLSSEVIARVLPLFLLSVIKASVMSIGFIEAIAEGTAIFSKLASGYFSDKYSKRKSLVFLGYLLSVLSRPLIILTPFVSMIGLSRFLDKVGKGIRTAPRDALIADLSTSNDLGVNFGIIRGLDTLGAVIGLTAVALFLSYQTSDNESALKFILWVSCFAGFLALIVLQLGVREEKPDFSIRATGLATQQVKTTRDQQRLDPRFKFYLVISFLFSLASSSDAFLIVRAKDFGFCLRDIFLILVGFNIVSALTVFPLSKLSDTWGRKSLLIFGWSIYLLAYVIFGMKNLTSLVFISTMIFYGLYYGLTDGVEKALVADLVSKESKATAYGWLGAVQGVGIIPANLLFASIYKTFGPTQAFWMSAFFTFLGMILLLMLNLAKSPKAGGKSL